MGLIAALHLCEFEQSFQYSFRDFTGFGLQALQLTSPKITKILLQSISSI